MHEILKKARSAIVEIVIAAVIAALIMAMSIPIYKMLTMWR